MLRNSEPVAGGAGRGNRRGLGKHSRPHLAQGMSEYPPHVIPVAYVCLGYASEFLPRPQLETVGWLPRASLDELIFYGQWGKRNEE